MGLKKGQGCYRKGETGNPAGKRPGHTTKFSIATLMKAIAVVEKEKRQSFLEAWIRCSWGDPKAMAVIAGKALPDKLLVGTLESELQAMSDEELHERIRRLESLTAEGSTLH